MAGPPSARLKTLESTIAKLQRQQIRLNRIQDIAGVRVVVMNPILQEEAIAALRAAFPGARLDDYRDAPQNGYRAVHLIVESSGGRDVEVQVRTTAQNVWANVSEAVAHAVAPEIKYGNGPADALALLRSLSNLMAELDDASASAETEARKLRDLSALLEATSRRGQPNKSRLSVLGAELRAIQAALDATVVRLRAIEERFAQHSDAFARIME